MKGIAFVVAVVVGLAIFGLPILGCLMTFLVVFVGVGVDAALTLGMFLTVAMVVGIIIKTVFIDD